MAESSDEQSGQTEPGTKPRTGLTRKAVGWTANQFAGWIFSSFLAGGGAVYALSQLDLIKITSEVERIIQENVTEPLARVQTDLTRLEGSVDSDHQDVLMAQRELYQRLQNEAMSIHLKLNTAEGDHRNSTDNILANRERTAGHFQTLEEHMRTANRQVASSHQKIVDGQSELAEQIQALSAQFDSYRRAIVDQLEDLQEEGRALIEGKTEIQESDRLEVEEWIAKANYMVRSLVIPTEAGLLRDTSVVKEELRIAMKRFGKEENAKARLGHARRALWVVEAMTDLATGGRIP